ncbi:hypothetical protein [Roseovarius sp. SYSU LYC5161]|uniref:hypothetical protein n=1 Tax=Roseovarius halophilus (ex Wu et al. 2025) TaxID=3376060 RepID=UPI00399BE974
MTTRGFYVVGVYGDGGTNLLTPILPNEAARGKSLADAKHSVWWQYQPRGECHGVTWYICRPEPTAPGVMIGRRAILPRATGGPGSVCIDDACDSVRLDIGAQAFPMTKTAHRAALAAIWPDAAGGDA